MYRNYSREIRANASIYFLLILTLLVWFVYNPIFAFASQISLCDGTMLAKDPVITLTPENPTVGGTYVISTAFSVNGFSNGDGITDGTEALKVTLGGFPVVNEELPLCENVPCPIGNGFHNFSWNGDVPSGVHGTIVVSEDWKMTNGTRILCFSVGYAI